MSLSEDFAVVSPKTHYVVDNRCVKNYNVNIIPATFVGADAEDR